MRERGVIARVLLEAGKINCQCREVCFCYGNSVAQSDVRDRRTHNSLGAATEWGGSKAAIIRRPRVVVGGGRKSSDDEAGIRVTKALIELLQHDPSAYLSP